MNKLEKIIIISSSMGTVGFGFLAYLQAGFILTEQEVRCIVNDVGYSNIWIDDIGILIMYTIASALCLSIMIFQGGRK